MASSRGIIFVIGCVGNHAQTERMEEVDRCLLISIGPIALGCIVRWLQDLLLLLALASCWTANAALGIFLRIQIFHFDLCFRFCGLLLSSHMVFRWSSGLTQGRKCFRVLRGKKSATPDAHKGSANALIPRK